MTDFFDSLERRDADLRDTEMLAAVKGQIDHARTATEYYQRVLTEQPIESWGDLSRLPVTRKSALMQRQHELPPFGGMSALASSDVKYIFASPGPIYEPASYRADFFRFARALFAAGFRSGDLVHNTFSYHLTPAGHMVDTGCHALGCTVVAAGVGQTELQVQTIANLKPAGYVGTPSFLKILIDKADELNEDVSSLHKALVSGEALPPSTRQYLEEKNVRTRQCYATADLGLIAYETEPDQGLIIDEGVYVEIVKPGTGDPVSEGEVGEVLVTTLNPDYPLIRFATGDLSAFMDGQSACGRTNRRIKGWMGRADQTAKVRGLFIHPSQIAEIVKKHDGVLNARLVIEWVEQSDVMTLRCETDAASADLVSAIEQSIRDICKVRGGVELLRVGDLPKDGVVIEDARQYD
ncbi:MAG: AMP-binding protein [Pseudomonadota bacterium]